jgi:hypothetical protein
MAHPKYRGTYLRARAAWAPRVAAGEVVCHLCHQPIVGSFHLDHVRGQPGVLHPAHPWCNMDEGRRWRGKRRLAWGGGRQN